MCYYAGKMKEQGKMLVKLEAEGNIVGIAPAINPDGSETIPPEGYQWIPCEFESYEL